MKKILLFFILLTAVSCDIIEYDGETRLVIQGQTVTPANAPIPGTSVKITIYKGLNETSDVISYGESDASGNFQLLIPAPKNENNFIRVELITPSSANQIKTFSSIMRKDFSVYKLDFGQIKIYNENELTQLTVVQNHVNPNNSISDIRITSGLQSEDVVEFNPVPPPDPTLWETYFKVLNNQMITLSYKVTDHSAAVPVTTEYHDSIRIDTDPTIIYTIQY